ncbi:MAG TPA: FAD-dependent oxidoreductase [Chloroflexota bacterium]|nr:FAD-dependent oxidoreductase [Chloroflexota bacterium]
MTAAITYLSHPPSTAQIIIVGGGVVGAATAFYAARAGLRPVLLERRPALCTLTTPVATGAFRLQFDNREELELVRRSVELFLNFAEITRQRDYDLSIRQQGYLWLTTSEAGAERQRRLVAAQQAWGQHDVELLGRDEVRHRFPYVAAHVMQARFRAGDGFLDPKALTMGLVAASGAAVVVGCGVTGFRVQSGRLTGVETVAGTVGTETAVIAAGPFSGVLAAAAGINLPITTVRRQKVILPDVPQVPRDAPMTIDEDTGTHWRPALHGAYLLCTDPATPPSPPVEDVCPDHRFAFHLLDPTSPITAARIVPFWKAVWERNTAHWIIQAGQYTMTPDHRPLLGPTAVPGLWVNTGYSGHGIMGGPAGSAHLVDLLAGTRSLDENPFRLDRTFETREFDAL